MQLHYTNYTTPQRQLHCTTTTTTAALHHTTSSSCGWGDRPGDHCNDCSHSKKHSSNHLSFHQWIRSAIRASQQPISPIGVLFLKLPPPPCAVLLEYQQIEESSINGWCLKFDDSDMKLQKYSNEKIYLFIDHHCKNALEVCYIIMMMLHNFETARGQYLTKFYDTKHFC